MSASPLPLDAITSSILKIISAASEADWIACFLTRLGSITPASFMSATLPVNTSNPITALFS